MIAGRLDNNQLVQRYLMTNSYVCYEVANSDDLTRMIYLKPQWWVGLGAGLGVAYSYKLCKS